MSKAPHLEQVLRYARDVADDPGIEELQRLGCRRFLDDLQSGRWDFRPALPEFCLEIMTGLFSFAQGERLDGTPLRGQPLELMPWHVYATYAICGFYEKGTELRRFTEADIFAPRKTVKTIWAEALQTSLALWYRRSGAKAKTVAGSLKQGMEGFDWLVYNFKRLGLVAENNPPGKLRLLDSSLGHSIEGEIWNGHIDLETLAFKPELFDSFNAQFVHLDELELYKNAIPYTRLRDGSKAFSNKLILCTFTAGDDGTGFAATHWDYMERILRGTITGPAADRTFVLLAQAPEEPDGSIDYLNPAVHRACNPAYGITIRPADMVAAAEQAEHNPSLRKEFFTRSLNRFVSSYKAWFDVEEFRRSDAHYDWTQAQLTRLVKAWYGGADLSKLHDLTAACLAGEIPRTKAAEWLRKRKETGGSFAGAQDDSASWEPPEDVLVLIPHAWFPVVTATEKADKDQIPLFGWRDDGWLDMPNTPSMDPTEPVKQFLKWKSEGFNIRRVGHDRKFARPYYTAMRKAGFRIQDQPQMYMQKSEGFRYIEHKAKVGCLYYLHAEPYEYCVQNVRAAEKTDDAVQYEKISDNTRIDIFDASVFATVRLLIDTDRSSANAGWFEDEAGAPAHPR
ncbi:MAG: terminase large subunit [Oscillospiraceae bacterium]|nr:terminase large subunit [Oscillospiraceae bacterium]